MIKFTAYAFIILLPMTAQSSYEVDQAKKSLELKLERREVALKTNLEKINGLRVPHLIVDTSKPVPKMNFGNEVLKCYTSMFPWPVKDHQVERKDCTYKLNIANDTDINRFYATLEFMQSEGWEVEKSETHKQNRLSDTKIINEERYRFVRSKK